eukprot:TRINITY_DN12326_c0_g2_i1.p1 TRINITY_DN12326_c0_g2~~TRINITY_DN12326_c0_g2_i1.p1  ORF type:complete len:200 (+),score=51.79 TRINITY_DN12326_c0_g2_i1:37-636(+)
MAYALALHQLDEGARKTLARASLGGIEAVTAGHGVPRAHPERLAITAGYRVLRGEAPGAVPPETYGSFGPDPETNPSALAGPAREPARFKGEDPRFKAQVARTLLLDKQAKQAKRWHQEYMAAKGIGLLELSDRERRTEQPTAAARAAAPEQLSVDVGFEILRASSGLYRSSAGRVRDRGEEKPSGAPGIFRIVGSEVE